MTILGPYEQGNQETQTRVILQSLKWSTLNSLNAASEWKNVIWIYSQIVSISLWKTCAVFKSKEFNAGQIFLCNTFKCNISNEKMVKKLLHYKKG